MSNSDRVGRTLAVVAPAGCTAATATFALFTWWDISMFPTQADARGNLWLAMGLSLATCAGLAWLVGAICYRHEELAEQQRAAAWPTQPPVVVFSDIRPQLPSWGPRLTSPMETVCPIEGGTLHGQLLTAVHDYLDGNFSLGRVAGRDGNYRGHHFLCSVEGRHGVGDESARGLFVVRDAKRVGERRSTRTSDTLKVSEPSMLAAVVTFRRLEHNWLATCVELHALNARSVARLAIRWWKEVARECGLPTAEGKATATLDWEGVWRIEVEADTVAASEEHRDDAISRFEEVLYSFRVPMAGSVSGIVLDPAAEENPSAAATAEEPS